MRTYYSNGVPWVACERFFGKLTIKKVPDPWVANLGSLQLGMLCDSCCTSVGFTLPRYAQMDIFIGCYLCHRLTEILYFAYES